MRRQAVRSRRAFSLPRSARLRGAAEIQAIFQHGDRDERRSFVVMWLRRDGPRRVGFAVSRRVGSAVDRNRVRRRLREVYRRLQHCLPDGVGVVILGRSPALTRGFAHLLEEMQQAVGILIARTAHAKSALARQ